MYTSVHSSLSVIHVCVQHVFVHVHVAQTFFSFLSILSSLQTSISLVQHCWSDECVNGWFITLWFPPSLPLSQSYELTIHTFNTPAVLHNDAQTCTSPLPNQQPVETPPQSSILSSSLPRRQSLPTVTHGCVGQCPHRGGKPLHACTSMYMYLLGITPGDSTQLPHQCRYSTSVSACTTHNTCIALPTNQISLELHNNYCVTSTQMSTILVLHLCKGLITSLLVLPLTIKATWLLPTHTQFCTQLASIHILRAWHLPILKNFYNYILGLFVLVGHNNSQW